MAISTDEAQTISQLIHYAYMAGHADGFYRRNDRQPHLDALTATWVTNDELPEEDECTYEFYFWSHATARILELLKTLKRK